MQKGDSSRRAADDAAGPAPAYPIASVDNALRLLMLFRDTPRVRLSEASGHLGVAHSTAHRLMAMLAELPDAEVTAIFADQDALTALTSRSITSCAAELASLI